ncbi:MAG: ATP-grasp domain-containing protein [Fimbriimonadaceae bacterium]
MVEQAAKIAKAMYVRGMMNIQFVLVDGQSYVLEVNPRASRTVPYLSKVTGIQMVKLATRCMMGESLAEMGYTSGLWVPQDSSGTPLNNPQVPTLANGSIWSLDQIKKTDVPAHLYAVKAPVFSFQKLGQVEPSLGPEMKSTGEVLGVDTTYEAALYKALIASGIVFKPKGQVILTVSDQDKSEVAEVAQQLHGKAMPSPQLEAPIKRLMMQVFRARSSIRFSKAPPTSLSVCTKEKSA